MPEETTLLQYAFANETAINKVLEGSSLIPAAAKKALRDQAALIRHLCGAIDALKLQIQAA
jgi:hypothetical protein